MNKPEVIDWMKENREKNILSWYLMEAMSQVGNKDLKEFKDKNGSINSSELNVVVTVNGIQVPFEEPLRRAEKQFDSMVESKALEIINANKCSLQDMLEEVLADVVYKKKELLEEFEPD